MSETDRIFIAGFDRILLDHARTAAATARGATVPQEDGAHSITAFLMCAAGLEAHVGEWVARFGARHGISESHLKTWRNRGLPEVVKDIVDIVVPGTNVADLDWYNNLCAIYKVRNSISHYFPEPRSPGDWPDPIKGLITGKIITPAGDATMDWTSRLFTATVAQEITAHAEASLKGFDRAVGWAA